MELKVGDYVRTERGNFHKITDLKPFYENDILIKEKQFVYIDNRYSGWNYAQFSELIINSSPNIIDLIQAGDYVNGYLVTTGNQGVGSIYIVEIDGLGLKKKLYENDIKLIVTKEQFESMEYRIGD